jgi:lipopolysaccharide/colanic/teichoic acid biosynthesis glycosyltransferase
VKRLFDILFSLIGLLVLCPFMAVIAVFIKINSDGPIFFKQLRVGKDNTDFLLFKFRTMHILSEAKGQLTVGMKDSRITTIGYFLRRYKLDEIPQLWNVLKGEMSFVGPRPEVRKYVDMYNETQLTVLSVKPGITDYASIIFIKENELLGNANDPEKEYIENIMPEKLRLNIKYINENNLFSDIGLIFRTVFSIIK